MYILENVPLSAYSTMRLGGPARFLTDITSRAEIAEALAWASERNLPVMMIGGGSNIIWSDEGFPGLVMVNKIMGFETYKEDDAVRVWEMAGYTQPERFSDTKQEASPDDMVQPVIVMPMDARIVYTDMLTVQKSKYGLTINFMQSDGIGDKPLAVSRVGMSFDHAQKLLTTLQKALTPDQPKLLPAPESKDDKKTD